ncbi:MULTISPECIES: polysaccharide biosynthesis C-terminal domain-containing protein [Chryseobacterium]|uniref:O-antigen/teichoic acid export membrane protein n=1 Tax=Chryseobacterium camelliae TaxID=1265445 RepID=A0ABU0TLT4_9FLAO|nr:MULTISPECIES: polysaccharide biosynthesis C-terminal domain-containing protein [Chryseobacterium]MDT3408142.1 O-antigen/teichoic acid export membrane protein [Pseudacidovorax intermedius]MDQ1098002.1 O-antigen/teichoic acid export membrane protein [Chryseobacterium camelliae]MDQ1101931.1 O-antigen/teichoic acid export membrane protein [Chryseobacterium sp. SORGH_AS_1048]MDR6085371.1 O-antigen/teichoic acid export membrane protein [Chryseobacterium sp. SORGH_AS_0909]MDR6129730.1 O-antigen/te
MKHATLLKTFVSRFLILILNFGLVVYSTNVWGSEGKGVISIVIADLTVISFFASIFVGSSITYFAPKYKTEEILLYAYAWSLLIGITMPLLFAFTKNTVHLGYLTGLSVSSSLLAANVNLFVGQKNIRMFNVYTILQQAVHIAFIALLVYGIGFTSVSAYFLAQIVCYSVLFFASLYQIMKGRPLPKFSVSGPVLNSLFNYGWKTQLSAFFQFLNNRLSFYFLEYFRGMMSVGVFSVGVAFSEAIWTVSRSLSVILYADVVNSSNSDTAIQKAKVSMRISFLVTLLFITIILLVPSHWYALIFGKDFSQVKKITLLLAPGIMAIAVSNIIGYYFAGINKLRILNMKSLIGLIFTLVSSFIIIPRWGIAGACIITSVSYCLSSSLLFWRFYQETPFYFSDFILSRAEIRILVNKFLKK